MRTWCQTPGCEDCSPQDICCEGTCGRCDAQGKQATNIWAWS